MNNNDKKKFYYLFTTSEFQNRINNKESRGYKFVFCSDPYEALKFATGPYLNLIELEGDFKISQIYNGWVYASKFNLFTKIDLYNDLNKFARLCALDIVGFVTDEKDKIEILENYLKTGDHKYFKPFEDYVNSLEYSNSEYGDAYDSAMNALGNCIDMYKTPTDKVLDVISDVVYSCGFCDFTTVWAKRKQEELKSKFTEMINGVVNDVLGKKV